MTLTKTELAHLVEVHGFNMQNTDWVFTKTEIETLNVRLYNYLISRGPRDGETALDVIKTFSDQMINRME